MLEPDAPPGAAPDRLAVEPRALHRSNRAAVLQYLVQQPSKSEHATRSYARSMMSLIVACKCSPPSDCAKPPSPVRLQMFASRLARLVPAIRRGGKVDLLRAANEVIPIIKSGKWLWIV